MILHFFPLVMSFSQILMPASDLPSASETFSPRGNVNIMTGCALRCNALRTEAGSANGCSVFWFTEGEQGCHLAHMDPTAIVGASGGIEIYVDGLVLMR